MTTTGFEWHVDDNGTETSAFVLAESALDRAPRHDRDRLFCYLYGDAQDWDQRVALSKKSRSEVDLDFATLVATYSTRDPELVEKVMRESFAGVRPRWSERRGKSTWLQTYTIPRALRIAAGKPDPSTLPIPASGTDGASGPQVYSLSQLKARPDLLKPREAVVPWLAYRRRLVLLAAREKAGKSTLLTAGAGATTAGRDFLCASTVAGQVLWVSADREDEHDIIERAERFGVDPERLHVLYPGPAEQRLAELDAVIAERQPVWVIIDTMANFAVGLVERASQPDQWPAVLLPLRQIAHERNVAVTLSAHAKKERKGKSGGYRDSTAIGALVDMILEMERDSNQPHWRQLKAIGRWTLGDLTVELDQDRYRLVGGAEAAAAGPAGQERQRVVDAMADKEWSAKELATALGISKDTAGRRLNELIGLGKVLQSGKGKRGMKLYRLVTVPQEPPQRTTATAPIHRGGAVAVVSPLTAATPDAAVCGGAAVEEEQTPEF